MYLLFKIKKNATYKNILLTVIKMSLNLNDFKLLLHNTICKSYSLKTNII